MESIYYFVILFLVIPLSAFILKIICLFFSNQIEKKATLKKLFELLDTHDMLHQSLLAASLLFQLLSIVYLSQGVYLILMVFAPYICLPIIAIMLINIKLPRTISKHIGKKINTAKYYYVAVFTFFILASAIDGSYNESQNVLYLVWAIGIFLFIFILEFLLLIRLEYKKITVPFQDTVLGIVINLFYEKMKRLLSKMKRTCNPVMIYRTMTLQKASHIIIIIPLVFAIVFDIIGKIYTGGSTGSTFMIDFGSSLLWYLISWCLLKLITYNKKWLTIFSTLVYSCYLYIHCLWIYLQGTSKRVEPERLRDSLQGRRLLHYELIEHPTFFIINVLAMLSLLVVFLMIIRKQYLLKKKLIPIQKESTND